MANELQPLSLLFQNRLFRIPDYQRGYAWQQSQLTDFWDDLVNLQEGRYHYTGLLSLKNLKSSETTSWGGDLWMVSKGFKPCHIVDGQQRLTTFVILLNEIVEYSRTLKENVGGIYHVLRKVWKRNKRKSRPRAAFFEKDSLRSVLWLFANSGQFDFVLLRHDWAAVNSFATLQLPRIHYR